MPKKRTSNFKKLTIAQQQEIIDRFQSRKEVRAKNAELAALVLSWVLDTPVDVSAFMELFESAGHRGAYHENPGETTRERVLRQAASLPNITKRLDDTPLDYSGALELSYIYERIQEMIDTLEDAPRGTTEDAIELYRQVGERIRVKVYAETGHYPEEFPFPSGKITGEEEPTQFKLVDHQPQLFGEEE